MPDRSLLDRVERELRAQVRGRVLDLGDFSPVAGGSSSLEPLVSAGERFDSVVSISALSRHRDPSRTSQAIEKLLADDGELYFLEPTAVPGLANAVQRAIGRRTFDIPAILRDAGLSPSVCERITLAMTFPARTYVYGTALRTRYPRQVKRMVAP